MNKNDYTVTSFVFSKDSNQLSNKRALFHLKDRLGKYKNNNELSPVSVAICPTSYCVRKCEFCSNTERNRKNSALNIQLSSNVLYNLSDDLNQMGVKGVSIAGGGEPLTYEEDVLNQFFLKAKNYKIGIHTNGVFLNKILNEKLIKAEIIDYINISVLAHSSKLYKIVANTEEKQFYNVENNIKHAQELKKHFNHFPKLGVKILISRSNYKFIKEIFDYFNTDLNLDNILLRCVGNFEENQDVELSENQKNELQEIMTKSMNLSLEQTLTIIKGGLIYKYKNIPIPSKCWINELKYCGGIDPDGKIFLCSPWSFEPYSIGNINKNNLKTIWGSAKHENVIDKLNQNLKNGKCNPLTCRHYFTNIAIDEYIVNNNKSIDTFDLSEDYCRFI